MKKILILFLLLSSGLYAFDIAETGGVQLDNLLRRLPFPNEQTAEISTDAFKHYIQENVSPHIPASVSSFVYVDPLTIRRKGFIDPAGLTELEVLELMDQAVSEDCHLQLTWVRSVESHPAKIGSLPCQIIEYGFLIEFEDSWITLPVDVYFHNSAECSFPQR